MFKSCSFVRIHKHVGRWLAQSHIHTHIPDLYVCQNVLEQRARRSVQHKNSSLKSVRVCVCEFAYVFVCVLCEYWRRWRRSCTLCISVAVCKRLCACSSVIVMVLSDAAIMHATPASSASVVELRKLRSLRFKNTSTINNAPLCLCESVVAVSVLFCIHSRTSRGIFYRKSIAQMASNELYENGYIRPRTVLLEHTVFKYFFCAQIHSPHIMESMLRNIFVSANL